MDPEQFVAQLAELRTQNQQLHQELQQVQQQQSQQQQQSESATKSRQTCYSPLRRQWGAAVLAAASPARNQSNLGGYERFGKASTVEEHGE